ncbi:MULTISPECIES: bifunctional diaminohydroxyphosphoribosylaminopyrimidine deaminase/5-amino-6-(5-phosphoribosylamino)uracil reductase RibD [unclassified Colwellia]|jgi:diaminohydroxyphosphoribosylaminopyrimidine deaminase/5-amino-6-(5-phosphoribosylamino)uracil reductase|uniref:bifunctional diaminohydroxyphosphoribosylaminopyrimidine deaminase/5-amino-6-(5-phosphoribosylamino)uracil reductase RibD n=1 Tax=unclassified Colwellia TaxID=196834 RepID=UPI0015F3F022|nr:MULTISPECIES: bifunctional diaminohydroxyphosphoribosylaminopyrimidine deaminase/5-amino-6-(5-phosphoribosylamino)uracil reductase RibD [unclassified Colwellia]MBA6362519.1 bifunctional diaminohydroxyphosphoribosylaminopyrimidine deaminase/5-amino-6-(5-phosphoribosylamino)uracil reductase RibD [Colwellia sp. BRX8-8]MBA6350192.1 bifunctional diaminohydroxyphosphoribosylaminopyrimidine deaminase/5-amino-6-(5-phosphoribosylamino)uracil reductase RibD [Colwellia sp. BRX8-9]MBA6373076.1 bifunction
MKEFSAEDYRFMQRAIMLAKQGHYTTSPNPRVGCVLVKDGKIVGEGFHQKAGEGHAEVNALAMAGKNAQGATAYVTLEPCSHYGLTPPCAKGLILAGIKHVIAAMVDPNPKVAGNGLKMLAQAEISSQHGLLRQAAEDLNVGFIKQMTTGLPYVRCKLAASLDGKTAMKNGESKWITSPQARQDVQRLRAQSCAIISGADSILTDNAKMTVRWSELGELKDSYQEEDVRQPIRVIIDTKNRLTPNLALFNEHSPIILIRRTIENIHQWPHFVKQVVLPVVNTLANEQQIDLHALLQYLAKLNLNDVLIESGARLAGAFIEQNLVDELILYQAPKLMGADSKSLVNMTSIESLSQAKELNIIDLRMIGKDIRIIAKLLP